MKTTLPWTSRGRCGGIFAQTRLTVNVAEEPIPKGFVFAQNKIILRCLIRIHLGRPVSILESCRDDNTRFCEERHGENDRRPCEPHLGRSKSDPFFFPPQTRTLSLTPERNNGRRWDDVRLWILDYLSLAMVIVITLYRYVYSISPTGFR